MPLPSLPWWRRRMSKSFLPGGGEHHEASRARRERVGAEDELGRAVAVEVGGHDLRGEGLRPAVGVVVAPEAPAGRADGVDGAVGDRGDDLRPAIAGDVDDGRGRDAARRVVVARAAHRRLAAQGQVGEAAVAAGRARAAVLRAVEDHERVVLGLVGLLHLGVRQPDDLVVAVAVEVGHRRRRGRPLQPARLAHVRPRADVAVVLVGLDRRAQPADELPPPQPRAQVVVLAVGEPRRRQHRGPVVVEDVDLVVVEGDDDLELRVVVEVADADVLAVGAVAVVADAVEVGVVAGPGQRVVARPRGCGPARAARRLVEPAGGVEDEDLRARVGGVRRGHHDLDLAVAVEVGGRHAARLGALAAAARRRRPSGLELELAADQVVGRHRPLVAAHDDLGHLVAVEVGDDARARRRGPWSPCPCRAGGRWRRRRRSSSRARRSRACRRR